MRSGMSFLSEFFVETFGKGNPKTMMQFHMICKTFFIFERTTVNLLPRVQGLQEVDSQNAGKVGGTRTMIIMIQMSKDSSHIRTTTGWPLQSNHQDFQNHWAQCL